MEYHATCAYVKARIIMLNTHLTMTREGKDFPLYIVDAVDLYHRLDPQRNQWSTTALVVDDQS